MLIMDVFSMVQSFFKPILDFFYDIWYQLNSFLLQYMSQEVINIFLCGIGFALLLIIILAIMNHK